jgi:outer membrane protein
MAIRTCMAGGAAFALMCVNALPGASAETIEGSLVRAYRNNPQLNAQRAQVRSTDELVPQALSGYRPRMTITATGGYQYGTETETAPKSPTVIFSGAQIPRSVGATVSQTLFNGQQTANRTRAAEGQVSAAREGLRVLEQTVLLSAATVYMDYLRDLPRRGTAIRSET